VLFSNNTISRFINHTFEPAWQSVRKAAIVRIDFGNGKTVTRTLNGNIATYICMADGTVLDVIPGVYDPETYLERLRQGELLYRWCRQSRHPKIFLKQYHRAQAAALKKHREPKVIIESRGNPQSIVRVESTMKLVLQSSLRGKAAGTIRSERQNPNDTRGAAKRADGQSSSYKLPRRLASRVGRLTPQMLQNDSRYNETVRRLKVHEFLAKKGLVQPGDITKELYKTVLDTDIDDPYLGLGKVLFGSYPFKDGKDGKTETKGNGRHPTPQDR